MKKLFPLLLTILMSACSPTKVGKFDSFSIEIDSLGVALSLKVDYPMDNMPLQRSLAQYVADKIFTDCNTDRKITRPTFNDDIEAFLKACAIARWAALEHDTFSGFPATAAEDDGDGMTADEMRQMAEEQDMSLSSYQAEFSCTHADDNVITWDSTYELYLYNTAHPSSGEESVTFNRQTGQILQQ